MASPSPYTAGAFASREGFDRYEKNTGYSFYVWIRLQLITTFILRPFDTIKRHFFLRRLFSVFKET